MTCRSILLGAGSLLALASAAHAQSPSALSEVVVTAAPFPVSIDSITTHVEIITRQELDAAPPAGLGDLLASSPGIRSTAYGPGASRPVIRGLSGPRVLVLENGVGLVDASALSPDHAVASEPGQASRIEVLRGPSALAYGGSGVGGVVNVIDDRIPSKPAEGGLDGRVAVSGGTVDDSASASGAIKANAGSWVLAADFARRRSDDYRAPSTPVSAAFAEAAGLQADPGRRVLNSAVDLTAYGAGASYVRADSYLGLSAKRTETLYGVPYPQLLDGTVGEGPVKIDLEQTRVDLRGETPVPLGLFDRARLSVGWADYEHAELEAATGEVGTRFLSDGIEGRLELIQPARGGWQGAVGLQALTRDLEAIGDEAFIPSVRIQEVGVFTLQRWEAGRFGLDAGLRLDRRELETGALSRDFTNVSAAAGLSFRPAEGWFLAASLSHNQRAPTEYELFADGPHAGTGAFELGDPEMDSEKVTSLEATVRFSRDRLRVEGHAFAARYDGFIEESPTGEMEDDLPVFLFTQTEADFHGGEVEASYEAWRAGDRALTFQAAADVVRGSTGLGRPPRVPPWSATARAIYRMGPLTLTGEARRVARQGRVADFETPTGAYTLLNARAEFAPGALAGLRLFLDARNLTDETAREHASFLKEIAPQPGRSARLGLAYAF